MNISSPPAAALFRSRPRAPVATARRCSRSRPTGCASDCGNNCPIATAVIETRLNADPGITGLALGRARPARPDGPTAAATTATTQCNHIYVTAQRRGLLRRLIALVGREPMAVRLQFGPAEHRRVLQGLPGRRRLALHDPARCSTPGSTAATETPTPCACCATAATDDGVGGSDRRCDRRRRRPTARRRLTTSATSCRC